MSKGHWTIVLALPEPWHPTTTFTLRFNPTIHRRVCMGQCICEDLDVYVPCISMPCLRNQEPASALQRNILESSNRWLQGPRTHQLASIKAIKHVSNAFLPRAIGSIRRKAGTGQISSIQARADQLAFQDIRLYQHDFLNTDSV